MKRNQDSNRVILSPEVWSRVFESPLYNQILDVLREIFNLNFGVFDAVGLSIQELRCIRQPTARATLPIIPFCQLIRERQSGFERCVQDTYRCVERVSSTGRPDVFTCHAGLTEVAVPIMLGGKYCGCMSKRGGLLLHQPNQLHWEEVLSRTRDLDIDPEVLRDAYFKIIPISRELLDIMIRLLSITAGEIVKTAVEVEQDKKKMALLEETLYGKYNFERFIGQSQAIQDVLKLVSRVIDSDVAILIEGETGTGKELLANLIHYNSPRRQRPFLPINCGGLTETLLESELFGHVKGAFTGAIRDKKGLFEVADGGTIFLDEIAETSPALQVKLLRVLDEGTFLPVGSTQIRRVNVRFLSATNKDLKDLIARGSFREDLYYRISVIRIALPPLRDRKQDIPLLVDHFIRVASGGGGKRIVGFSKEAFKLLLDYHWPGNIRELRNVVERAVWLSSSKYLTVKELPGELVKREERGSNLDICRPYKEAKEGFQREYLLKILGEARGSVTRAAQLARMDRSGFHRLLKRYKIRLNNLKER